MRTASGRPLELRADLDERPGPPRHVVRPGAVPEAQLGRRDAGEHDEEVDVLLAGVKRDDALAGVDDLLEPTGVESQIDEGPARRDDVLLVSEGLRSGVDALEPRLGLRQLSLLELAHADGELDRVAVVDEMVFVGPGESGRRAALEPLPIGVRVAIEDRFAACLPKQREDLLGRLRGHPCGREQSGLQPAQPEQPTHAGGKRAGGCPCPVGLRLLGQPPRQEERP